MSRTDAIAPIQVLPPQPLIAGAADVVGSPADLTQDKVYVVLDSISMGWVAKTNEALKALSIAISAGTPLMSEIGRAISGLKGVEPETLFDDFTMEARNILPEQEIDQELFKATVKKCRPVFQTVIENQRDICRKQVDEAKAKIANIGRDSQSIEKLWAGWRLPAEILQDHLDCAMWLKETFLFDIRGYQRSSPKESPLSQGLRYDAEKKQPLILMNGEWTEWRVIKEKLVYVKERALVFTKRSEDEKDLPEEEWNYFWPNGLVPESKYANLDPIFEINKEDQATLLENANKFWTTNTDPFPVDLPKNAVVQFYTTKRKSDLPKSDFFYNARNVQPSHVGIRIITEDGKVHDPNYDIPQEDYDAIIQNLPWSFLTTGTVKRSRRDFDEFGKPYEVRRVTSISVPETCAQEILEGMKKISTMRFNYTHQNCAYLAGFTASKIFGEKIEFATDFWGWIGLYMPDLKHIPYIGWLLDKVAVVVRKVWNFVVSWTPGFIKTGFSWTATVLTYIPHKISTFLINIIGIIIGGSKYLGDLEPGEVHDLDNSEEPKPFKRLYDDWSSLFSDRPSKIFHSYFVIQWQRKQLSTYNHRYRGTPRFTIVPGKA